MNTEITTATVAPETVVIPEPILRDNKFVDSHGVEFARREDYEESERARLRAAAQANADKPETRAKYIPTTTDMESIKKNLKASLSDMNREANKLESRGVPYLVSLADYAVTSRVATGGWPDKEKLKKFLRDSGAEPDKSSSTYTKTIVNQAVNIVRLVTSPEFNVHLGYRIGGVKAKFQIEKPADDVEFTRVLLTPDKLVNPKVRAGKEFIDNNNETLVPISFNVANKLLTKLTKGVKQRQPNSGTGGQNVGAAVVDTVAAYGPDKLCEAMGDLIVDKGTVPTKENITSPFELACRVMGKVNAAAPDKIPEAWLAAMIALKTELDERIELQDDGKYKVVSVDGTTSYIVNPDSLPA